MCVCVRFCVRVCECVCVRLCVRMCVCDACMRVPFRGVYVCMRVCLYAIECVYVCVCPCVYCTFNSEIPINKLKSKVLVQTNRGDTRNNGVVDCCRERERRAGVLRVHVNACVRVCVCLRLRCVCECVCERVCVSVCVCVCVFRLRVGV